MDAGNDVLLMLSGINRGRLVSEVNDKLDALVDAVTRYSKKGTLGIAIEIEPGKEEGTVGLKATVTVKAPQPEHPAVFFIGDGARLQRDDPTMDPMFGRDEIRNGGQR